RPLPDVPPPSYAGDGGATAVARQRRRSVVSLEHYPAIDPICASASGADNRSSPPPGPPLLPLAGNHLGRSETRRDEVESWLVGRLHGVHRVGGPDGIGPRRTRGAHRDDGGPDRLRNEDRRRTGQH